MHVLSRKCNFKSIMIRIMISENNYGERGILNHCFESRIFGHYRVLLEIMEPSKLAVDCI